MARPRPQPGSQSSLREANRTRLLEGLRVHGHLTQVELAGVTGLSPATVSNIVKELSAAGVLQTAVTARSGRRAIEVRLAHQAGLVAGVHVSSRHMRIAIADVMGTVLIEHNVPLAPDHRHDAELDRVALMLTDMLESLDSGFDDLLSVGVAVPYPVDPVDGRIAVPRLVPGWHDVAVQSALGSRVSKPVVVDSETNAGALAEARHGEGRGVESFVYLRVGSGITTSIVVGGRVLGGAHGRAGQLGHTSVDRGGAVCHCGKRGCLETVAGGAALLARFRDDPGMHRVRDLVLRADAGGGAARRTIADAGREIGQAAAALCDLVDPALIVVGGELAEAGEQLLAPLRHALEANSLRGSGTGVEVVNAALGVRSELVGAISIAARELPLRAIDTPAATRAAHS
ncbi:MAG: ROK family transcriptional regulator [Microbacteriaceae bacterium]